MTQRMMKPRPNRKLLLIAAVICAPLAWGCGHGDRPALGMVHGTVTLDGRPLVGATVLFQPVEPGRTSIAVTGDDGRYELVYLRKDKGAKVGAHVVQITSRNPAILPPRYNTQSILKAEVKRGTNTIDFPLTSK
jgi:hypothetical protein